MFVENEVIMDEDINRVRMYIKAYSVFFCCFCVCVYACAYCEALLRKNVSNPVFFAIIGQTHCDFIDTSVQ